MLSYLIRLVQNAVFFCFIVLQHVRNADFLIFMVLKLGEM